MDIELTKMDYINFPMDKQCYSNGMYNFWFINKDVAQTLIGRSITDNEFMYECCNNVRHLTSNCECMNVYGEGVLCNGNTGFLARESLGLIICRLQNIYDNYYKYFEKFMNQQFDIFVHNCRKFETEHDSNTVRPITKKTPAVAKNPKGYIYVMKNCGYYKIGKAQIGSSRFGEYTKLPEEPEYVIKVIVGNYNKVETALHERYKNKRLRDGGCEWFELEDSDIEEIRDFVNQYVVEE